MIIKPITVHIFAYGQKANISSLQHRSSDLLKDEHGTIDARLFVSKSSADIHAKIIAQQWDHDVALKKATPSQPGIAITLPDMNERLTIEWLHEIPVAKTCVIFATWVSHKEKMTWQMLIADGNRSSESRPT